MKRDYPLTLFAWCFVVLVASFMPWGTVGTVYFPLFSRKYSLEATGWNGVISVLGMSIPNWIVVVIAVSLAFIGWLQTRGVFVRPQLPYWLAVYGIFHAAVFVVSIVASSGEKGFGVGSIATLVAFVSLWRAMRKPHLVTAVPAMTTD